MLSVRLTVCLCIIKIMCPLTFFPSSALVALPRLFLPSKPRRCSVGMPAEKREKAARAWANQRRIPVRLRVIPFKRVPPHGMCDIITCRSGIFPQYIHYYLSHKKLRVAPCRRSFSLRRRTYDSMEYIYISVIHRIFVCEDTV